MEQAIGVTEQEYLRLERAAEFKSEYVDGEIFARSGSSIVHAFLQQNLAAELQRALTGSGCRAVGPDLRVRVSSRMYAYPDMSIICGKPELADEHMDTLINPCVIFEITSPSTENYDRGLKWARYRAIASLREYVLLSQKRIAVEQYTRQEDSTWTFRECTEGHLKLESIGISIPLVGLYSDIELRAEAN